MNIDDIRDMLSELIVTTGQFDFVWNATDAQLNAWSSDINGLLLMFNSLGGQAVLHSVK
jgi:hypothetical protein